MAKDNLPCHGDNYEKRQHFLNNKDKVWWLTGFSGEFNRLRKTSQVKSNEKAGSKYLGTALSLELS